MMITCHVCRGKPFIPSEQSHERQLMVFSFDLPSREFLTFLCKHLYCLRKENMVSLFFFLLVFCYTEMLIVHLFYITSPFVSERER